MAVIVPEEREEREEREQEETPQRSSIEFENYPLQLELEYITKELESLSLQKEQRFSFKDNTSLQTLMSRDNRIVSDKILRGDVEHSYEIIKNDVDNRLGKKQLTLFDTYFGATSDFEKRLKAHDKKFQIAQMHILYGSSRLEKSAWMESQLISRYRGSRNVSRMSSGLVFGKQNYFVYMLKFARSFK